MSAECSHEPVVTISAGREFVQAIVCKCAKCGELTEFVVTTSGSYLRLVAEEVSEPEARVSGPALDEASGVPKNGSGVESRSSAAPSGSLTPLSADDWATLERAVRYLPEKGDRGDWLAADAWEALRRLRERNEQLEREHKDATQGASR